MSFTRRKKYYNRCQEIIDDLHNKVANHTTLSDEECIKLYGKSDYYALLHELHMMDADIDMAKMTTAMEWFYHSQYFSYKAKDERKQVAMFWISVISAVFAAFSAGIASCSKCQNEAQVYSTCPYPACDHKDEANAIPEIAPVSITDKISKEGDK